MPAGFRLAIVVLMLPTLLVLPRLTASAQETPTPIPQDYRSDRTGYAGEFTDVQAQLNIFWSDTFRALGASYLTPNVVAINGVIDTGCGQASPASFAFYCPPDQTIYYSPTGFASHDTHYGDYSPIVVLAHEWGHHVQTLLGLTPAPGNAFELQADCLSGAFASEAGQQGLLEPGDVTEAVTTSADAADPIGLPQDAPGAHGTNDDRIINFMRGYLDGVSGCNLPLTVIDPTVVVEQQAEPLPLLSLVPSVLDLPQRQSFQSEQGTSSFADMLTSFADDAQAGTLLREWGWQENVYRVYTSDDAPTGSVDWLALAVHRFDTVEGAAEALPYFAAARRKATGFQPIDVGLFADQTEAMIGNAGEGQELIVYARRGNLVFRVDGIAPVGDPTADVVEALLVPLRQLVDEPRVVSPELFDAIPDVPHLLSGLDLSEEHARSGGTIAATFPDEDEAGHLFQEWGWRESAARVFVGESANGTSRVEVSIFRFDSPSAAAEALPYFLDGRAIALGLTEVPTAAARADEARAIVGAVADGQEATAYIRRGRDLYRITVIGTGAPMTDLATLVR